MRRAAVVVGAPSHARRTESRSNVPLQFPKASTFAVLAHELRTPLATLHTTLDILADESELSRDDILMLVQRLQRSVLWLEGLIENTAIWSALESGQLTKRLRAVSVGPVIDEMRVRLEPLLARKAQCFTLDCPSDLPTVQADPQWLGQVLANLAANASAYSDHGDVIGVSAHPRGNWLEVRVTDHGPGVPESEQRRIFERYVRGSAAARERPTGMGLGLHIVKSLIELQGGEVGVTSAAGQGSEFWFSLPVHTHDQIWEGA